MVLKLSNAAAGAMASALATDIGAGAKIEIRSGTRPANPDAAATGTVLATIALSGSFTATGNTLTAADPAAVTPVAAGTATWFRLYKADGTTAKLDGDVGTSGTEMVLGTTAITTGVQIDLGQPSITVPIQ